MKKIITTVIVLLLFKVTINAQILQPVNWSYSAKKTKPTEAIIFIKATIDDGWHIYSQFIKAGGPVKTTITFTPSKTYILLGSTKEPKPLIKMEKVFGMEVLFFEKSVIFQQKIKIKTRQTTVSGKLEYMTCNDEKCLPPDVIDFRIPVK